MARKAGPARGPRLPREPADWLARALGRSGALPLAQAESAIRAGRVTVAGRVVRQPLTPLKGGEVIRLDGVVVSRGSTRVLAFHKQAGVVTSRVGQHGYPTVFERLHEVLPPELAGYQWHAVGRLDQDATGLLLFTNDEKLVGHISSPKSRVTKCYRVAVSGKLDPKRLQPLERGLTLAGTHLRPAQVRLQSLHELDLTLTEGKYHQVKRMLGELGYPVLALRRVAIGGVALDVPEGAYRELSETEIRDGLDYPPAR